MSPNFHPILSVTTAMANDRHSHSRRGGRNKSRAVTPTKSEGVSVAVAIPKVQPVEVKSQFSISQISVASPDSVALRAIETVENLAKKLGEEHAASTQTASPIETIKVQQLKSRQLRTQSNTRAAFVALGKPTSSQSDSSSPTNSTVGAVADVGLAWSQAVDAKLNELIERSRSLERESAEIESLRGQLQQAIGTAENRLTSNNDVGSNRIEELENQLIAVQEENRKTTTLLLHSRQEYQELLAFIESEAVDEDQTQAELKTIAQRVLEKTDARETELGLEVSQLNDQLQFLQSELADARAQNYSSNSEDSDLRIQIEQLRSQLLEARHEAVELRMQSNDLGARLAKYQGVSNSQKSETLTWEQRKEALLQQLEAETHSETPCDPRKVLEIEKVVEQTSAEIQRRDEEIADLKALIEQQSIAHEGMAIGVSAVAEMIESDALIVAERLRLKELREDWEQKQRQAEIEMSMERAKLARERLELQDRTQTYDDNNNPQSEEEKKANKGTTRGKWLARLGLRDE